MNQPTREYGWLIIDTPELKAKFAPRLSTDEFWSLTEGEGWLPVGPAVPRFTDCHAYRRRIDPGDGWEIVPANESPTDLDKQIESTRDGVSWRDFGKVDQFATVLDCIATRSYADILAFRRRATKQPRRFWAVLDKHQREDVQATRCTLFDKRADAERCTWLGGEIVYLTETDPPPPEKSPAEMAWEKHCQEDKLTVAGLNRAEFLAGFDAGRAAK